MALVSLYILPNRKCYLATKFTKVSKIITFEVLNFVFFVLLSFRVSRLPQISHDFQTISVQKRIDRGDAEYAEKRSL